MKQKNIPTELFKKGKPDFEPNIGDYYMLPNSDRQHLITKKDHKRVYDEAHKDEVYYKHATLDAPHEGNMTYCLWYRPKKQVVVIRE